MLGTARPPCAPGGPPPSLSCSPGDEHRRRGSLPTGAHPNGLRGDSHLLLVLAAAGGPQGRLPGNTCVPGTRSGRASCNTGSRRHQVRTEGPVRRTRELQPATGDRPVPHTPRPRACDMHTCVCEFTGTSGGTVLPAGRATTQPCGFQVPPRVALIPWGGFQAHLTGSSGPGPSAGPRTGTGVARRTGVIHT